MDLSKFKPVPEHPQYLVSESGEVYSTLTNKLFTKRVNSAGYYQTCFWLEGKNKYFLVSRVVASAYLGMSLYDETVEVDHIDNDKSNNHYTNLQVLSKKDHKAKTLKDRNHKAARYCSSCGLKIKYKKYNESYKLFKCKSCRIKRKQLSEEEIENLIKELGSWLGAAKKIGMSDNGLRKMYIRVSGGKDPKLLKKKIKSQN